MPIKKTIISFHLLFLFLFFGAVTSCSTLNSNAGNKSTITRHQAEMIYIYRIEVARKVQENWKLSKEVIGEDSNPMVCLVFKVMPNGEIRDIFYIDRSGNPALDNSAYQAVLKSSPVRPHPKNLNAAFVDIGLRFTPEGIR
jgi:colicin import membrane protein